LKQAGLWPLEASLDTEGLTSRLCRGIVASGWSVAFSPLIRARAGAKFKPEKRTGRPPVGKTVAGQALARYGIARNFQ
jgi:hypothetical protein